MEKTELTESGKKYVWTAGVILLVYFAMKYLSPIVSPFIVAFLVVGFLNPLVTRLGKRIKLKKSILAGMVLLLFCGAVVLLCWLFCGAVFSGGRDLAKRLPEMQQELQLFLRDCCAGMENRFGVDGVVIENFVMEQVEILAENIEVNVFPVIMGKSVNAVRLLAGVFSFLVVTLIAVLLIIKDYDRVMGRLIEEDSFRRPLKVCVKIVVYIKTYMKAQLVILLIISGICALTLGLAGIKGGIVYGIITGFMDMLPFVGTGIMLLPLALFLFFQGYYLQAVVCAGLYIVCALIREFLEPKLIGGRVGVWPVGILFAVFAGIKLFGISGIIKGPLALVIICEICRQFWNQETKTESFIF